MQGVTSDLVRLLSTNFLMNSRSERKDHRRRGRVAKGEVVLVLPVLIRKSLRVDCEVI